MRTLVTVAIGGLVMVAAQMAVGLLWPAGLPPVPGSPLWGLGSDVILAATLAGLASRSRLHGAALAAWLFGVAFVIGSATAYLEAVVFAVLPMATVLALLPMSSVPLAAGIVAIVVASGAWSRAPHPAPAPGPEPLAPMLARGAAASALYVVCYFGAGTLIFPWVQAFYEAHRLPSFATVLSLQLFVRGPIFVLTIALLVRELPGPRRVRALAAGAAMSLLGGVVPLFAPNPFFPDVVRWAHFVETASSNFVFGVVTGWLMSSAGVPKQHTSATSGTVPDPRAIGDSPRLPGEIEPRAIPRRGV